MASYAETNAYQSAVANKIDKVVSKMGEVVVACVDWFVVNRLRWVQVPATHLHAQ